jgi:hypothetical protein
MVWAVPTTRQEVNGGADLWHLPPPGWRLRQAKQDDVDQECDAGLQPVRRSQGGLAFAAPLIRSGAVVQALVEHIATVLRIDRGEILDAAWADNRLVLLPGG